MDKTVTRSKSPMNSPATGPRAFGDGKEVPPFRGREALCMGPHTGCILKGEHICFDCVEVGDKCRSFLTVALGRKQALGVGGYICVPSLCYEGETQGAPKQALGLHGAMAVRRA
jgi:hypothetical protein